MKKSAEINQAQSSPKHYIVLLGITVFMSVLIGRLFQLQVIDVGKYKYESTINHVLEIPIRPPRGDIFDRNGVKLAQNHIQYDLYISTIGNPETDDAHLESISQLVGLSETEIEDARKIMNKASGEAPVLVKTDIPLGMVVDIKEKSDDYQYVLIEKSPKRSYPFGEITAHVIGYLREIDEKRLRELRNTGYSIGDIVGEYGIERQYETNLRGASGLKMMEVDNRGNWKGLLKKWVENPEGEWVSTNQEFPPAKGKDLALTLDIELQKRVANELGEHVGGVIVMEPTSGEILAMYCYPSFDSNLFVGPVNAVDWSELMDNPQNPMQNRMIQNSYPPGSVFKALMAFAGFEENVITAASTVTCRGKIEVGNREFKCWKLTGHGTVDVRAAMAYSCDVFFYTIGQRLGVEKIAEYCGYFGLDKTTGIDLPNEKSGFIPSEAWKKEKFKDKWYTGDTVNMSIGQGFLQLTPIGLLRNYAFFANGGKLVNPHLNKAAMTRDDASDELKNLHDDTFQKIQDGLLGTVEYGTARACKNSKFKIAGKTGTADDLPRKSPHSWFISYAPFENPKVVMLVFCQNGGHGDEKAVPIAKKIYNSPEMQKYIINEKSEIISSQTP